MLNHKKNLQVGLSNIMLFICLVPISTAQTGDSLRLQDVVKEVVARNDRIAAARFMEKSAFEKAASAGAWDDPMLMVGVQNLPTSFSFNSDPMTMKMIGISQNIPYAGEKGQEKNAARSDALAMREEKRGTIIDIATAAKYAYLDLYYRQKALEYILAQREIQNDVLSSVTARLRSDQASQADVAAAQADLWRIDADINSAQQDVDAAKDNLLSLMGRDQRSSLPPLAGPGVEKPSVSLEQWLSAAESNYPRLKRLERKSESFRYLASMANRMRWPMLGLSGGYGFRSNPAADPSSMGPTMTRDDMVNFQVALSIPIFSARSQGKMAGSMIAMERSSMAEVDQLRRDVDADLNSLYTRAQRLWQNLNLYRERIIPADEDAYRSAFAGYESNRQSFSNLLIYTLNIYRDRLAANRIEADLAKTLAEADKYITNPDVWDNINSESQFKEDN